MNYSDPGTLIACLGLGSNIGDSRKHLTEAIEKLQEIFGQVTVSPLYRTKPRDFEQQDDFFNCCVIGEWDDTLFSLLNHCLRIEQEMGRSRTIPKGPRTIDIDLLWVNNLVLDSPSLVIPHPRLTERGFALAPMLDLVPDAQNPRNLQFYKELLPELLSQGIYSESW